MPHEPKKRHSTKRQGKRRASISLKVMQAVSCLNCGKPTPSHTVCKQCGFYGGKQVLKKSKKNENAS